MSLIEKLAELRELEGRLQAIYERQKDPRSPNYAILERIKIERKLLDTTQEMIDILSEIRPGDEDRIYIVISLANMCNSDNLVNPPNFDEEDLDCLRRYAAMAQRMEARE